MTTSTTKNTQIKSIRFPHIVIEGLDDYKENSVSFTEWVIDACKEKLKIKNDYYVDELMKAQESAKQLEKNRQINEERQLKKLQKQQAKKNS
jgi:hypothetical protein